jgi:pyruvyltransferase
MIKKLRQFKKTITRKIAPEIKRFPDMPYPTVEVFSWHPAGSVNFGDELARTIVDLMLAQKGLTMFDEVKKTRLLMSVGSVLHLADNDTVVWGTGRSGRVPDRRHLFQQLDIRAVRGPRTRDFLISQGYQVPEVFGDPGLLLPALTGDRFAPTHEKEVVFIPNLNDYEMGVDFSSIKIPVLNPRQSWNKAIAELLRYNFVLASSLHGLIIAEAYGIPARYVRLSDGEDLFKYHDYYEGTGRLLGDFATSVPEGMEMGGNEPLHYSPGKLMQSFPYDLWR